MSKKHLQSIGIFDSGFGGLTVMKELIKTLPNENVIYFGDNARLPYGDKSNKTIIKYSEENILFLLQKPIKLIIIACHTASAIAYERLKEISQVPLVDMIYPTITNLVNVSNIAILGTIATINSQVWQKLIYKKFPLANLYPIPCPLLVPIIEEGFFNHKIAELALETYLKPIKNKNIDTILLACTHYPLLKNLIQARFPKANLINPADFTTKETEHILKENNLLRNDSDHTHLFFTSDNPIKFKSLGEIFLQKPIKCVVEQSFKSI